MVKKIAYVLLGLVTLTSVLFGGAFALAQTQIARDQVAGAVEGALQDQGLDGEVEGIEGLLPFDVRIGRVRLKDEEGIWFELDDAAASWSPTALLSGGAIQIDEVSVARIAVARAPILPPTPPAAETETPPAEPFDLESLRALTLPEAVLETLRVDRIELGADLVGRPAVFRLDGDAAATDGGTKAEARLDLTRTDEPSAALNLEAAVDFPTLAVDIALDAREEGGIVGHFAGRDDVGPLTAKIDGRGPLADWRADLAARAEGLIDLDAALAITGERPYALSIDGGLVAGEGLLPADVAPLIGERLSIAVDVAEDDRGQVRIEKLDLRAAFAQLSGDGAADLEAETVEGVLRLQLPDLALASGLAGGALEGSGVIDLGVGGALYQPTAELALDLSGIGFDAIAVDTVRQSLIATPLGRLDGEWAGVEAQGDGALTGLALDGGRLLPTDALGWSLAANAPAEGAIDVAASLSSSDDLVLNASALLDAATLAGSGRLDLALGEFARWVETLGPDLTGGLALEGVANLGADIAIGEGAQAIDADFALDLAGLGGLPAPAGDLLGREVNAVGKARYDGAAGEAGVDGLALDAGPFALRADLGYGLADQRLSGQARLEDLDLAALEAVAGQPLEGRGDVTIDLGGSVSEPDIAAAIDVASLAVAGVALDRLGLDATLDGPIDAPAGAVRLEADAEGGALLLESGYALKGQSLRLSDLSLTGPATALEGGLAVDLEQLAADGSLQGSVGDLAALAPFHGQNLEGAVTLDAVFASDDGQALDLDLEAVGVAGDFGALERVVVAARGERLTSEAPDFEADVALTRFIQPGLRIDGAEIKAVGAAGVVDLDAQLSGNQGQPFSLDAALALDVLGDAKSVRLDRLNGVFAGSALELEEPATLELEGGALELDNLDLKLEQSRIQSYFLMDHGSVRAAANVEAFPLTVLEKVGMPAFGGEAAIDLEIFGEAASPQVRFDIAIDDLAYDAGGFDDLPTATFDVGAVIEDGELIAGLNFTGLTDEPAVGSLSMPLLFSLDPFALDIATDAPIAGGVRGDIDLARLTALLALDGQSLEGVLSASLDIAGSMAAPDVQGAVTLDGGRIEVGAAGTVLSNVDLSLIADAETLTLERFRAEDGIGGTIGGVATIALDPASGFPFEAALDLDAELVRLKEAQVTLTGPIEASGDLNAIDVMARITVDPAELRIPSDFAVNPPVLQVVNLYAPGEEPVTPPPSAASPSVIALDVEVDVPARMFVRGRGLESEWGGSLQVKGVASNPDVTGAITLRRGILDLLDRRFELREGSIELDGAFPPNPTIYIDAAVETDTITAVALLEGSADNPTLTLTSEPELPQDEVLAELLFGRDLSQITPAQGVRLAAAVARLQGNDSFDVLGQARDALGVDTLDVGGSSADDASVKAGKYIAENIFVEVERGVAEGSGKAVVEIELNPFVTLDAEVTETSQSGVGAEFKFDY